MPSISEELFLLQTQHAHYTNRYGAYIANQSLSILDRIYSESRSALVSDMELLRDVFDSDTTPTNSRFRAQLRDTIANIAAIRNEPFDDVFALVEDELRQFSEYESQFQLDKIYNKAASDVLTGSGLALRFDGISAAQLYAATLTTQVALGGGLNGTLDSLLKGVKQSEQRRMFSDIESGFIQGRTNQEIIRGVFNKQNGAAQETKSRRAISSLVRTATNSMGNKANELIAEKNSDLVRGYRNLGVYDSRQSAICQSISVKYGDTVLPNYDDFPPVPRHLNCRSMIQMVLKPWNEILKTGKVQKEEDLGTQSFFAAPTKESSAQLTQRLSREGLSPGQIRQFKEGISGQTSARTLNDFLGEQKARGNRAFLNTFFDSEERAEIYISGKMPLKDLYDYENRKYIPLSELDR